MLLDLAWALARRRFGFLASWWALSAPVLSSDASLIAV